ncbi:MAG: hypothetical protein EOO43_06885 [Flavobacterium sp.]|nr:MAG: hypothetical protein EOO43_06885 [Flavobacterium sp.]
MSKEIKIDRKKGEPTHGNTDYERLKNMTEDEINRNAEDDDLPLQSDEELKQFKKVNPKKE